MKRAILGLLLAAIGGSAPADNAVWTPSRGTYSLDAGTNISSEWASGYRSTSLAGHVGYYATQALEPVVGLGWSHESLSGFNADTTLLTAGLRYHFGSNRQVDPYVMAAVEWASLRQGGSTTSDTFPQWGAGVQYFLAPRTAAFLDVTTVTSKKFTSNEPDTKLTIGFRLFFR